MQLRRTEIEANVLLGIHSIREAEADENIVRKNFTIEEMAEIDEFFQEKEDRAAKQRQRTGKQIPSGNFPKGRARENIAARVGVSGRTLEKIRTIKRASTEGDTPKEIWKKIASGK